MEKKTEHSALADQRNKIDSGGQMTHTSLILARLKSGKSITAAFAYNRYGIMRLASRVFELRQRGHAIRSTLVRRDNKSWAEYKLT